MAADRPKRRIPVENAVETISSDGKTFTDTLWEPDHEDNSFVTVFVRQ
jgi:hypothetical protein